MLKKMALPLVAILGFGFAVKTVIKAREVAPPTRPLISPPTQSKFKRTIAGSGIVESRLENIPVGSPVSGVAWEVFVKVGNRVKKGDPLFRIDERDLNADLEVRQSSLASAIADARRLEAAPQIGDVAYSEAAVDEARAKLNDLEAAFGRSDRLFQRQMLPATDYDRDRYAFAGGKAALSKAIADLGRLKVTWEADKRVAQAKVAMADSQVKSTRIHLDRLTVRALADGEILQVNVRPGQYAAALGNQALVIIGDSNRLHVRVDIDENDVPLFDRGAKALATLKGRPGVKFEDLTVVKVEPYIIPKRSLTGDNSERVDTRVLQVVYALPDNRPVPLYVGQQMDAYIEAAEARDATLDTDLSRTSPFPIRDGGPAQAEPVPVAPANPSGPAPSPR